MTSFHDFLDAERARTRERLATRGRRIGEACGREASAAVEAHPWLSLGAAAALGTLAGRAASRVTAARLLALVPLARRALGL